MVGGGSAWGGLAISELDKDEICIACPMLDDFETPRTMMFPLTLPVSPVCAHEGGERFRYCFPDGFRVKTGKIGLF
jgi:hypothetical protein